jgi:hypothetical protein
MDVLKLSAEWSGQIGQCLPNPTASAILLIKLVLPSFGNPTADSGSSKMEPFNVPLHPPARYSPWDGIHINFTSNKSLIRSKHNCFHSYNSGWWVRHEILLDSIALIELKLSFRIKHFSGGCVTSLMTRKAINKALSLSEKTPAGLENLNPNPPTPVRWF